LTKKVWGGKLTAKHFDPSSDRMGAKATQPHCNHSSGVKVCSRKLK